uniref:SEO_C domain-containing protein n=1 Tax=Steinernema glaseri TaxID=37863 RepID=A0A1I7YXB5_9BILA
MDGVPFAFYEHLTEIQTMRGLSTVRQLSGTYGELAFQALTHSTEFVCTVRDGTHKVEELRYMASGRWVKTSEEIDAVRKKFVRQVWIFLKDAKTESVSREIIRRFPYAHGYNFVLESSSINEAWVNLAFSLRRLGSVSIRKELDDNALRLFQKLVTGQKLWTLTMRPGACEGGTLEMAKSLLCQEQFQKLRIRYAEPNGARRTTPVRELLDFWSANSDKLRGKRLIMIGDCKDASAQLEEFLLKESPSTVKELNVSGLQKAMEVCSKEECDLIARNYFHNHIVFWKPSCVYKYEEGEGEEERRLYISFDCHKEGQMFEQCRRASHEGHKDLFLMRDTTSLYVMFA